MTAKQNGPTQNGYRHRKWSDAHPFNVANKAAVMKIGTLLANAVKFCQPKACKIVGRKTEDDTAMAVPQKCIVVLNKANEFASIPCEDCGRHTLAGRADLLWFSSRSRFGFAHPDNHPCLPSKPSRKDAFRLRPKTLHVRANRV